MQNWIGKKVRVWYLNCDGQQYTYCYGEVRNIQDHLVDLTNVRGGTVNAGPRPDQLINTRANSFVQFEEVE